jgi:hypothetical protein
MKISAAFEGKIEPRNIFKAIKTYFVLSSNFEKIFESASLHLS